MDKEQKKKWDKKIAAAKQKTRKQKSDAAAIERPDINAVRKKFRSEKAGAALKEISSDPDMALEEDINVEVKSSKSKAGTDDNHDSLSSKQLVIKSKTKGIKGFTG